MESEVWKDIEGYENKYQVSNLGNVKSLNFNNTKKERLLKPKINRYGYREVKLSKNNKTKGHLISTLVARAFLFNNNPDKEIAHIGETTDDRLENLKYEYRSKILHDMYKKGHRKIGKPSNYNISYNGKQYKNISEMARDNGISPKLLHKRVQNGWTLEESIKIPRDRKSKILNVKLYEYNNKIMSVKQLSDLSGISSKTIYKRLARGWDIESAVEIPLRKKKERI